VGSGTLKQVGDGVPVSLHSGDVIAERPAGNAVEVATLVVIGQRQVGDPDRLPRPHLVAPLGLGARAGRDTRVNADRCRITPGFFGITMQCGECRSRFLAGRVGERHPTVAPFGTPSQRHIGVTAIPQRDLAPGRPRVDAGILDRVPFAFEGDVRLNARMTSTCSSERRPRL